MDFNDQELQGLTREDGESLNQATEKVIDFYRHLLTVSAGSLGLLTGLHASSAECLYTRLVYLLVVVTLAIGILTSAIVLHGLSMLPARVQKNISRNEDLQQGKGVELGLCWSTRKS